jgi:hypothetical protein
MASLGVLIGCTALLSMGCATQCHDEVDPETGETVRVCTAENLVHYTGASRPMSQTYAQGANILVDGVNGNIDISTNNAADTVGVVFHPFTKKGNDPEDKEAAGREMEEDLHTEIFVEADGTVVIKASRSGGTGYLGCDIDVNLPNGYTGGITVDANNGFVDGDLGGTQAFTTVINDGAGDVTIRNAAGPLDISGSFDLDVKVSSWSTSNGQIVSTGLLGDIIVYVPAGADGSIQATSEDEVVVGPSSLPSDWVEEAAADNSKTFTFGAGAGGIVQVSAAKSVTISAN